MRNSKAYEIVYQSIVYRDFDNIIVRERKEERKEEERERSWCGCWIWIDTCATPLSSVFQSITSFSSDIHNNHISYNLVLMLDKKKLVNKSLNLVSHHR